MVTRLTRHGSKFTYTCSDEGFGLDDSFYLCDLRSGGFDLRNITQIEDSGIPYQVSHLNLKHRDFKKYVDYSRRSLILPHSYCAKVNDFIFLWELDKTRTGNVVFGRVTEVMTLDIDERALNMVSYNHLGFHLMYPDGEGFIPGEIHYGSSIRTTY